MERVLLIGSPCAGKTTLALALGKKLDLPVIHLDTLHWRDGWVEAPREEFDALLSEALARPRWIIDGNYSRTLPLRLSRCDTVVYLDYPRLVCLWGAVRRVLRNRGVSRPDMGGDCPERFDPEFLRYIWSFRKTQRGKLQTLLAGFDGRVITLRSRREAREFVDDM